MFGVYRLSPYRRRDTQSPEILMTHRSEGGPSALSLTLSSHPQFRA